MIRPAPNTAETLLKRADEISANACKLLLGTHPEIRERFGASAQDVWERHLNQLAGLADLPVDATRVNELASQELERRAQQAA